MNSALFYSFKLLYLRCMISFRKLTRRIFLFPILILASLVLTGCYTLSGSSIHPTWETINIATFPNYAPYQNPNLSPEFTNKLQDIFNNRTKLSLTNDEDADLYIDGEITSYNQTSVAIQANEIAGKNRLTITVRVRYENRKDETKSFDKNFSAYEDFESNQTLQQAESALLESIIDQLTQQIFNAVAMDW
jgi:hypothetical protein